MKEGPCHGCIGQHKFKHFSKKSKITANMMVNPMEVLEESEDDLLNETQQDYPKCILAMFVTKKVPTIQMQYYHLGHKGVTSVQTQS